MALTGGNSAVAAFAFVVMGALPAAAADDLSKGVPSKEALSRKTALKLAGLATFVSTSCPNLKLDPSRFRSAITGLGLTTKDLDQEPTKFAYLQYTMAYKKDVKANCERARSQFGPNGKTLPNLFVVVDAPAAPASGPKAPQPGSTPDVKKP